MGSEALIAFDHGVPNNVPRLLHRKAHGWTPLFLKKVTSDLRGQFNRRSDLEKLVERLHKLRQLKLAESPWLSRVPAEKQLLLLFLASLSRRPRFDETISRRTGLLIPEVRTFMALASSLGWIDEKRRLTAEGHRQLEHARRWHGDKTKVLAEPRQPYYPQTLRAPK
jgi:hypothetical protein